MFFLQSSALRWGYLEVVRILLDFGAAKDPSTEEGFAPLHLAAWKNHLQVARLLVESGGGPAFPLGLASSFPPKKTMETKQEKTKKVKKKAGDRDVTHCVLRAVEFSLQSFSSRIGFCCPFSVSDQVDDEPSKQNPAETMISFLYHAFTKHISMVLSIFFRKCSHQKRLNLCNYTY